MRYLFIGTLLSLSLSLSMLFLFYELVGVSCCTWTSSSSFCCCCFPSVKYLDVVVNWKHSSSLWEEQSRFSKRCVCVCADFIHCWTRLLTRLISTSFTPFFLGGGRVDRGKKEREIIICLYSHSCFLCADVVLFTKPEKKIFQSPLSPPSIPRVNRPYKKGQKFSLLSPPFFFFFTKVYKNRLRKKKVPSVCDAQL